MSHIGGGASRFERVVKWYKMNVPDKTYFFTRPPGGHYPDPNYPGWIVRNFFEKPLFRAAERLGVHFYNNVLNKTQIGLYQKGWNPRVHGVYCQWRYYGNNPDVPVWDCKVRDVPAWFRRRDYSIVAIYNEIRRVMSKVKHDYYTGPVFSNIVRTFFHLIFFFMFVFWMGRTVLNERAPYRHAIYHW